MCELINKYHFSLSCALVEVRDARNGVEGAVYVQVAVADVATAGLDDLRENDGNVFLSLCEPTWYQLNGEQKCDR